MRVKSVKSVESAMRDKRVAMMPFGALPTKKVEPKTRYKRNKRVSVES